METERLLIRQMVDADERAFAEGVADRGLRIAYGFPADMDATVPLKIFHRFRNLPGGYSLIEKETGRMAGFLLDVEPELPEETAAELPAKGRTLAFAVFPTYQRRGLMQEALERYICHLFSSGISYIHCGHFTDNEQSRRLLNKLGFQECARHSIRNRIIVDEILTGGGNDT